MNLLYDAYPDVVILCDTPREIVTDFKDWLRFVDMLRGDALELTEKAQLMMEFYLEDIPVEQWVKAHKPLLRFFRMEAADQEPDERDSADSTDSLPPRAAPLYDFRFDAKYIIAGFWQDYRIDLTETDMHWWKFRILLDGLSAGTEFKQRVMYRNTNAAEIKDVKERQRIQRIQRAIAIPQPAPTDFEIGELF